MTVTVKLDCETLKLGTVKLGLGNCGLRNWTVKLGTVKLGNWEYREYTGLAPPEVVL